MIEHPVFCTVCQYRFMESLINIFSNSYRWKDKQGYFVSCCCFVTACRSVSLICFQKHRRLVSISQRLSECLEALGKPQSCYLYHNSCFEIPGSWFIYQSIWTEAPSTTRAVTWFLYHNWTSYSLQSSQSERVLWHCFQQYNESVMRFIGIFHYNKKIIIKACDIRFQT